MFSLSKNIVLYLTFKFAIKYANISLIKRIIIYYYPIFTSSRKS